MRRFERFTLLATVLMSFAFLLRMGDVAYIVLSLPLVLTSIVAALRPHLVIDYAARLFGASLLGRKVQYEDIGGRKYAVVIDDMGGRVVALTGVVLTPPSLHPGFYKQELPVFINRVATIASVLTSIPCVIYTGVGRQVDKAKVIRVLEYAMQRRKGASGRLEQEIRMLEEISSIYVTSSWVLVYADGETVHEAIDKLKMYVETVAGVYGGAGFTVRPASLTDITAMITMLLAGPEKK